MSDTSQNYRVPKFTPQVIANQLRDGYWLEAPDINLNSKPDLIGYGDGDDEFLIGLRGPWPWQGVMYYKAIDAKNGIFAKWRVSDESVAKIAVADFSGRGKLDFATIAYSVQHYYVAKDAKIMLYRNEIESY